MSERIYRLLVGLSVLGILYLDARPAMYGVIGVLLAEAITNWRIPLLVSRIRYGKTGIGHPPAKEHRGGNRFPFEAERALRLLFASVLLVTYILFNKNLWLFPWFAGFALAVAGLSGICPMLLFLEKLGFRASAKNTPVGAG